MKRPHASDDVRERALAAVDDGQSIADVAKFFQNDPSTIYRWLRLRTRTGSDLSRPRSGRSRLVGPEQTDALVRQVERHPEATLAEHCTQWQQEHGVRMGLSTMSRAIRRAGFTLKKRPWSPASRIPWHGPHGGPTWPGSIRTG